MRWAWTFLAALTLVASIAGCGAPEGPSTEVQAEVDPTDPYAVAEAWVRAWCEGDGRHTEYEFADLREPWSRLGSLPGSLPKGVAVEAIEGASMGVGGNDPETGFDLERYRVRTDATHVSRISTRRARALRYTIQVRLQDGRRFSPNLLLRPEGSLDGPMTADATSRWRVLRGSD